MAVGGRASRAGNEGLEVVGEFAILRFLTRACLRSRGTVWFVCEFVHHFWPVCAFKAF